MVNGTTLNEKLSQDKNVPDRKRTSQDGKYALITYLIKDKGLDLQDIIDLEPKKALELLPPDNKEIMDELKKYMTKNVKHIKESGLFFPGRDGKASVRSILHSLHFYLKTKGMTLAMLGLKSRPDKKEEELKEPEDIMDWAKGLLEG